MNPLLEFRNVSYRIAGRSILRGVSLAVEEGETLVLLGRSGAGKTTLLRMANGMVTPTGGEVLFQGRPVREWDPIALRRRIGYVIQEIGLFPHFTVEANVGLVPRLEGQPPEAVRSRVRELLEQMGLAPGEFGSRYPRELSGGQKQRVGVARALAADPPLLLMDEPFGAADPVTRVELQKHFLELRRRLKKTAVFVTHDVREALTLGTRIALFHEGQLDVVAEPGAFRNARSEEARAFLACLGGEWKDRDAGSC